MTRKVRGERMDYKRLTKLSDLGTLHALDFNGEEQPLCELTALDIDVLIRRLYELENKIESGELGDVKEAEHRVAVAERALKICLIENLHCYECDLGFDGKCKGMDKEKEKCAMLEIDDYIQQAEKELAEELKNERL